MARYSTNNPVAVLPDSGVTAGSYTNVDLTVNSKGIVTVAANGASVASVLNDLTDVTLTGPITDQVLQYDGADWLNTTLTVASLSDINLSGVTSGDFLTFDGADWINSTIDVVVTGDIGTTVQAWDAELDAMAGLSGTGYVIHTGAGTAVERTITGSDGIIVTDGDGVAGNTEITVTIDTLPFTGPIDPVNDLLIFYNLDTTQNEQVSVEDAVLSATPITDAISVGGGFEVFKQINSKVLEFRDISSGSASIVVDILSDNIRISGTAALDNLSGLTPTDNNFIVGNGGSWAVEDATASRTSLGLGTMAVETAADYLALAGGAMTGDIDMATNTISDLSDPVLAQDAATMNFVELNLAVAGDGMVKIGNEIDVVGGDGITANADDIELDLVFLDAHTDALYYTQTQLADTTDSTEGASLIGTETKVGLSNATTVEAALDYIDTTLPFVLTKFSQGLSWNINITAPSPVYVIVDTIQVTQFAENEDGSAYSDFLLPIDFDTTKEMTVYLSMAKSSVVAGNVSVALAWQHQRVPGFTSNSLIVFAPGTTTVPDASTLIWTIPASTFLPLDVVTLRVQRLGTDNGNDTYTDTVNLFAGHITQ